MLISEGSNMPVMLFIVLGDGLRICLCLGDGLIELNL